MIHRSIVPFAALLALSACATAARPAAERPAGEQAQAAGDVHLQNPESVVSRMRTVYPQLLWDAGVTGTVTLELTLSAGGTVQAAEVRHSTHSAFSDAARRVVNVMRFSPPAAPGRKVWVRMRFSKPAGSVELVNP
jgi:TonB family protein